MSLAARMHGFVITLDTIAALSFLLVVMLAISSVSFTPSAPKGTYLKQVSQDLLTVLEKDGSLGLMIDGNSTPARRTLLAAPESVCMTLSVLTPGGQTITMISKPDCGLFRYEFQTASIPVMHSSSIYLATVESWHKRVGS